MQGKDIKKWLINNDMTQKELSELLGLTSRTLSSYCNGVAPRWFKYALKGLK